VLRSQRGRTAENSAAYLLSHLRNGLDLLDIGCGPGTITLDLARIVGAGHAIGIDGAAAAIEAAEGSAAAAGSTSCSRSTTPTS
jgi:precorrin-6B methylase 2